MENEKTVIENLQQKIIIRDKIINAQVGHIETVNTHLESQKEEIERLQKPALYLAYRVLKQKNERDAESFIEHINGLEAEIEGYKTTTELAIKTLEMYGDMIITDSEDHPHDVGELARKTLAEINDTACNKIQCPVCGSPKLAESPRTKGVYLCAMCFPEGKAFKIIGGVSVEIPYLHIEQDGDKKS